MKSQIPNRIIIIGGNHQNTLAAIRCFGICKCNIHILLHADEPLCKLTCAKTRFSNGKTSVVGKSKEAIYQWLLTNKTNTKQILFPCSDLAAYTIDENYKSLCNSYIIPGFKNQPGKLCEMMSKWEQKIFADEHGFNMAKSWQLKSNDDCTFKIPRDIVYPCIVKPDTSAFGIKTDISICANENFLEETLEKYANKKYKTLLVQEYLNESNEYGSLGCIVDDKQSCVCNIIKRLYANQGNTVYAKFINEENIRSVNDRLIEILHAEGYRGLFDVEYLVSNNTIYLLEINFRHSGIGFGEIDNKVYTPYLWGLSIVGLKSMEQLATNVAVGKTLIDETVCLRHRKEYGISIMQWLWIVLTADAHAKFNIHDLRGTIALYASLLWK